MERFPPAQERPVASPQASNPKLGASRIEMRASQILRERCTPLKSKPVLKTEEQKPISSATGLLASPPLPQLQQLDYANWRDNLDKFIVNTVLSRAPPYEFSASALKQRVEDHFPEDFTKWAFAQRGNTRTEFASSMDRMIAKGHLVQQSGQSFVASQQLLLSQSQKQRTGAATTPSSVADAENDPGLLNRAQRRQDLLTHNKEIRSVKGQNVSKLAAFIFRHQDAFRPFLPPNFQVISAAAAAPVIAEVDRQAARTAQLTVQPACIKNGSMRDYQLEGLKWMINLHDSGVGGILADEMG